MPNSGEVVTISGRGHLGTYLSTLGSAADAEFWRLERDVIGPLVNRIAEVKTSRDYTEEGRGKQIAACLDEGFRAPELSALRKRVERAGARRDEVRREALSPATRKIVDLESLFAAMVQREEAKEMAQELGRDAVRIFDRFIVAVAAKDDVLIRALFPLRIHLPPELVAQIDERLIAASPRAELLATIEEEYSVLSGVLHAAERDLLTAASAGSAGSI